MDNDGCGEWAERESEAHEYRKFEVSRTAIKGDSYYMVPPDFLWMLHDALQYMAANPGDGEAVAKVMEAAWSLANRVKK